MLKLLSKISLIILFVLVLSLGIDGLYRHAYGLDYTLLKNIFIYPEITDKYEMVKVGNSHAEDGLTFERYKLKSLSLASVAQSFEYDLPMLKMYSRQIKEGAVIIINASPLSFSQKKPGKDDNVNTNYYDGRLSPFLIPHIKVGYYVERQVLPFARAGLLWREKHAEETKEQAMSTYAEAWKEQKSVTKELELTTNDPLLKPEIVTHNPQPGNTTTQLLAVRSRSFSASFKVAEIQAELSAPPEASDKRLIESTHMIVNKWMRSGDFGTQYFDANRKDLEDLISYCLEKKWRPVLITLPVSQVLLDDLNGLEGNFLKRYVYDHVEKVERHDVNYFDFASNPQLTKNRYLFGNSDHLNPKGAAIVSYLLLQKLIDADLLPKAADGYDYTL